MNSDQALKHKMCYYSKFLGENTTYNFNLLLVIKYYLKSNWEVTAWQNLFALDFLFLEIVMFVSGPLLMPYRYKFYILPYIEIKPPNINVVFSIIDSSDWRWQK